MNEKKMTKGIYVLKALALAFVFTLILLLVISVLITYTSLKESSMPLLNTIIMVVSITSGSFYLAIKAENNGWLNGGLIGILYFVILIFLNYLFIEPFAIDTYLVSKFLISLITGVIGGMIGVNTK